MSPIKKVDPARLYSALLNTGLQTKDNPLYQVIYQLIGLVLQISNDVSSFDASGGGNTVINEITQVMAGAAFITDGIDGFDGFPGQPGINGTSGSGSDYVVMSDGGLPIPSPVDDGFGNFVYIIYVP